MEIMNFEILKIREICIEICESILCDLKNLPFHSNFELVHNAQVLIYELIYFPNSE